MKILVISLLRLGDLVISAPIFRALCEKYVDAGGHATVDLLINSQFAQIENLLPEVRQVHHFQREILQKGLGDAEVPLFSSFDRLEKQIDDLNGEKYDLIINLTQNRLSGWLLSLLEAKQKTGLSLDSTGRASFGSEWFRFLNTATESDGAETFHFVDIFRNALELDERHFLRPALVESDRGRTECHEFLSQAGWPSFIAIQALTSDTKKDWGLMNWQAALKSFARVHPGVGVALLCAPNEVARLQPLVDSLIAAGVPARLAEMSFEGAYSLLKKAKLLISGDTSIKHLAAAARTPLVELSLGSSDPMRTGAYRNGAVILQSREACAPCVHSSPCHRATHACATRLSPDAMALVASEVFSGRDFQLPLIAEEYASEMEVLRVDTRLSSFWAAPSVLEPLTEKSVGRWIDLACKKIWLTTEDRRGSEIRSLAMFLRSIHSGTSEIEWRHLLADLEKQVAFVDGRINGLRVAVDYLKGGFEDPKRMSGFIRGLILFRERLKGQPLLASFTSTIDQIIEDDVSVSFTKFRRITEAIFEIEKRTAIHLCLIRGLMNEFETERNYAEGAERA